MLLRASDGILLPGCFSDSAPQKKRPAGTPTAPARLPVQINSLKTAVFQKAQALQAETAGTALRVCQIQTGCTFLR